MRLLLDTHVLLWWLGDDPTLSPQARAALADGRNPAYISSAVIWEISIKRAIGKLKVPKRFRAVLDDQPFEPLDITPEHAHAVGDLPLHHRDPFDRMLVAQAKIEGLTLVTRDKHLAAYKLAILAA
jgi:PIN domain nuclease of toxin-antitoxin system